MPTTKREKIEKRIAAMEVERSDFMPHWREISEFIQPRRGRFQVTDKNRGGKRHQKIINGRATMASRTLASGLMSGLTSPARPWFKLGTPDPDLMRVTAVREWLQLLTKRMFQVFASGNLYQTLPVIYMEMGLFGTSCMTHVDDYNDIARYYPHTIGSFVIAQNDRLEVDTLARTILMPVRSMAAKWGTDKMSQAARSAFNRGDYETLFEITHYVSTREQRDVSSPFAIDMPFESVYFESGSKETEFLGVSGFQEAPFYVPRWDVTEADTYGVDCPGMTALGDVKALQILEREKAIAVQKKNNPPLKGPGALSNVAVASIPGGVTLYDGDSSREGLQPVYQVQPDLRETEGTILAHQDRIDQAFFADLFNQLSNLQGVQPRNELELSQRNQEKLLMLGPLLERAEGELLDPMINRTANQIFRANILPPPPQELFGQRLRINYISPLAIAQQQVATGTIDRLVGFIGGVAQIDPAAIDNLNSDEAISEYEQLIGSPPRVTRGEDEVAAIRQQRAQQQQAAQALEMAGQAASAAKDAGVDLSQ